MNSPDIVVDFGETDRTYADWYSIFQKISAISVRYPGNSHIVVRARFSAKDAADQLKKERRIKSRLSCSAHHLLRLELEELGAAVSLQW